MATILQFDRVSFAYRGAPVFTGLDLSVGEGEMAAVLGPNGSGKTTLVRLAFGHLGGWRGCTPRGPGPVDPGGDADKIVACAEKDNLHIEYIFNTHHHWDHTTGNARLKELTGAKLVMHALEDDILQGRESRSRGKKSSPPADIRLDKLDNPGRMGGEAFDAQVMVQKDRGNFNGVDQVLQVIVGHAQSLNFAL